MILEYRFSAMEMSNFHRTNRLFAYPRRLLLQIPVKFWFIPTNFRSLWKCLNENEFSVFRLQLTLGFTVRNCSIFYDYFETATGFKKRIRRLVYSPAFACKVQAKETGPISTLANARTTAPKLSNSDWQFVWVFVCLLFGNLKWTIDAASCVPTNVSTKSIPFQPLNSTINDENGRSASGFIRAIPRLSEQWARIARGVYFICNFWRWNCEVRNRHIRNNNFAFLF